MDCVHENQITHIYITYITHIDLYMYIINQDFTAFIESKSGSEVVKKKLEEEWVKHTTENNIKTDSVWQKDIKGKKESFQRDKAQKNSHTDHHNTDNSLKTKERDGSNR